LEYWHQPVFLPRRNLGVTCPIWPRQPTMKMRSAWATHERHVEIPGDVAPSKSLMRPDFKLLEVIRPAVVMKPARQRVHEVSAIPALPHANGKRETLPQGIVYPDSRHRNERGIMTP
jgi:hypothetical protein